MDFFKISGPYLSKLSDNDKELFDFVVENMENLIGKSIREVAAQAFVSSATFLRFVQKIGFSGYSEFSTVIKFTVINKNESDKKTTSLTKDDYSKEYLKNINESIRVIPSNKVEKIINLLATHNDIYFFSNGVSKHLTEYIYYLYTMAGFSVHFPRDRDYRRQSIKKVNNKSLVFILSYHGNNDEHISMINDLHSLKEMPKIISITQADNNIIQNLSDVNLYIFTDDMMVGGNDITSHVSMIAILELILYQYIKLHTNQKLVN